MTSRSVRRRGALGWISQVAAWLVILGVLAVLAVAVGIPRIAGATPYTVLTGSMTPGLPPGTLVVVRPTPAKEIGIGTVVTYQLFSGEPVVVTHRVVGIGYDGRGQEVFQTQGDANNAPDVLPVQPAQIRGVLWYAVPHLGRASNLVTSSQRATAQVAIAAGLLGYAALMFLRAARGRMRSRRSTPTPTPPPCPAPTHQDAA